MSPHGSIRMKSKSNSLWVMLFGATSLTYVGFVRISAHRDRSFR